MLNIEEVSIKCGKKCILREISLSIQRGECVALVGANGAGKSTLLRSILGLTKITAGRICWEGQDLEMQSARFRAQRIAYVPQTMHSDVPFNLQTFVAQGMYCRGDVPSDEIAARVQEALCSFGLWDKRENLVSTLSGGERQRALLASAVVQGAELLLLDEPSASLDPRYAAEFYSLLKQFCRQKSVSVLMASHDLNFIAPFVTRTITLKDGAIVGDGPGFATKALLQEAYSTNFLELEAQGQRVFMPHVDHETKPVVQRSAIKTERHLPSGIWLLCLIVLVLLSLALLPSVGAVWLGPEEIFSNDTARHIWLTLRLPRILWGALAGATLAMIGAAFQSMLQNPLATPYTLGLASGASLGAMLAMQLGLSALWGVSGAAFAGALLVMLMVLGIAKRLGVQHHINLLLSGVAASLFCSALVMLVQAFAEPFTAQEMLRWQMGGVDVDGFEPLLLASFIVPALVSIIFQAQALNLIATDADLASSRGVAVGRVRFVVFVAASLACAGIVSVSGPISFVGLLVPHFLRRFVGADNCKLFLACLFGGALFLMWADTAVRLLSPVQLLPVGVLTALLGAPALVFILMKSNKAI